MEDNSLATANESRLLHLAVRKPLNSSEETLDLIVTECVADSTFEAYFQYIVVAVSVLIILLFSILERRSSGKRCRCFGDHPGLIYPVNMLDDGDDRFGYAAAFGSTASAIWNLFTNPESYFSGAPNWSKSLVIMGSVLYVGMLYYPLFACLTTPWVFLGSTIGFLYTGAWFIYNIRDVAICPDGKTDDGYPYQEVAQQIPILVCLLVLLAIFAYKFVRHTRKALKSANTPLITRYKRKPFAEEYNRSYVKQLITPPSRIHIQQYDDTSSLGDKTRKFRYYISKWVYQSDPMFKFSTKVICVLTVSIICAYEFGIILILMVYQLQELKHYLLPDQGNATVANRTDDPASAVDQTRLALRIFSSSVLISFAIASCVTLYSIFQILVNYRKNLKLMYKGAYSHFPFNREDRRPHFIMSDSLAYAGTQVGYILWGYIILFVVLLLMCFLLAYLIILPLAGKVPKTFLLFIVNAIPALAIYQGLVIIQQLSCEILLQSRQATNEKGKEVNKSVLAVDNRKIYHNVSYFLFFFYIVLGIFGCLMTIIKGMTLGVFYLARLDKCGLFQGFEQWDKGYMYYLSFLYVEESHRHPVLLVFCDTLYEYAHRHEEVTLKQYGASMSTESDAINPEFLASQQRLTPSRKLIRNRWLKAYTLIRNPSLVKPEEDDDTSCDKDDGVIILGEAKLDDKHAAKASLEC